MIEKKQTKILMIEDDIIDQKSFSRFMNKYKQEYEYQIAGSVAEAKRILSEYEFDIIISDYLLGDGTAFKILEMGLNSPVIFLTGAGDEKIAVRAIQEGAVDYLVKDFKKNYLRFLLLTIEKSIKYFNEKKELKAHQQRWRMLLENLPGKLYAVDKKYKILFINKIPEKKKEQDYFGTSIFELIKTEWHNMVRDNLLIAFQEGEVTIVEYEESDKIWFEFRFIPISGKKNVDSVMILVTDITKDKEIESMKDEFIDHVSHELRTPITSIKGFANTIITDDEMDDNTRNEFLTIIDKESDRLTTLINDILDLSKINSGNMQLEFDSVPILDIVQESFSSMSILARDKEISLSMDFPSSDPLIVCDRRRLLQVILNLISNAVKFTDPGGEVIIRVKDETDKIVVMVIDNGIGIADDQHVLIFNKFHQADQKKRRQIGTGLGLSIVGELLKAHNSEIHLESKVGEGSTFWFELNKGFDK